MNIYFISSPNAQNIQLSQILVNSVHTGESLASLRSDSRLTCLSTTHNNSSVQNTFVRSSQLCSVWKGGEPPFRLPPSCRTIVQ